MSKSNNFFNAVNAVEGVKEAKRQVNTVINSSLTEEEKVKALKSHDKMVKVATLFTVVVMLIFSIIAVIGVFMGNDMGIVIFVISVVAEIALLIVFAVIGRKKLFPEWMNAYEKVDKSLDNNHEHETDISNTDFNEKE